MTFLLAFLLFSGAVAAMAVGVLVSGRKIVGSCGGLAAKNGEDFGDCVCVRKAANLCGDDADHELVELAEVGWPKKRTAHRHEGRDASPPPGSLEV